MKIFRYVLFALLVLLYGFGFAFHDQKTHDQNHHLGVALPASFYRIASGYLKQLAAEILFIRTSVFLGGVRPGTAPTTYEEALGSHFEVITKLYPRFLDTYYYCHGFLPYISLDSARKAVDILAIGIGAYPNDFILRLFHGSIFYLRMNEPSQAARAFREAAKLHNAPQIFARLAALLSAQGGDIVAGLISLKVLLENEKDEIIRVRYKEDILIFEKALKIQQALHTYNKKYGTWPIELEQLIPEYLQAIPEINGSFILEYNPPNLYLKRPDNRKISKSATKSNP